MKQNYCMEKFKKVSMNKKQVHESKQGFFLVFSGLMLVLSLVLFGTGEKVLAKEKQGAEQLNLFLQPVGKVSLMYRQFFPVKKYLEKRLDISINMRVKEDLEATLRGIEKGEADIAYLDPSAYCRARHKYKVAPLVKVHKNREPHNKSALVARKDSGLEKIVQLRGKSLALGKRHSTSSSLMPLAMFNEIGLGLKDFSRVEYLQKEDQVALSVLVGDFDVGGISLKTANKYRSAGLRVIKQSKPLPQYLLCVSRDMDKELASDLKKALLEYRPSRERMHSFAPVQDREYNIVRIALNNTTGDNYLTYPPDALKLGILPLYSSIKMYRMFSPLAEYLTQKTGREFRLVIPKDFEEFVRIVKQNKVDFAYQNPYVFLLLNREIDLRPLVQTVSPEPRKPRDEFRGAIIAKKDSDIRELQDLVGKKIMIVSQKSAGGHWFQKLLLQEKGIDIQEQAEISEGKRHEQVVLAVYRGKVDAGFIREAALSMVRETVDMQKIRVVDYTSYFPNWPLVSTPGASNELIQKVEQALIELQPVEKIKQARICGFNRTEYNEYLHLENLVDFK